MEATVHAVAAHVVAAADTAGKIDKIWPYLFRARF
jgi:hypothetical protein